MVSPASRKRKASSAIDNSSRKETQRVVIRLPNDEDEEELEEQQQLAVLGSSPGGFPGNNDGALTFEWRQDKNSKRKPSLIGKDDNCLYTSTSNPPVVATSDRQSGSEKPPPLCGTRMCVGIYDKEKKSLTLFNVHGDGFVYPFVQSVPTYKGSGATNNEMTNSMQRRKALFEDFGSAKKLRVIKSQEANRVNVESVVGAGNLVMDSVLKGESMSESNKRAIIEQREQQDGGADAAANSSRTSAAVDEAANTWRNEFLPPFDRNAKEVSRIYNAVDIVGGSGLWHEFLAHVSKVVNQADDIAVGMIEGLHAASRRQPEEREKKNNWRPSLIALVRQITAQINNKNRNTESLKKRLTCAYALHFMLHLYKRFGGWYRIPEIDNRPYYYGTPSEFGRFWVQSFTTEAIQPSTGATIHIMSKPNKDKCCVSMLLLLLMADGGESMTCSDIQPFVNDLQMDIREAGNLLRVAGCTVTRNSSGSTVATLTLPLTFPPLKLPNKRK